MTEMAAAFRRMELGLRRNLMTRTALSKRLARVPRNGNTRRTLMQIRMTPSRAVARAGVVRRETVRCRDARVVKFYVGRQRVNVIQSVHLVVTLGARVTRVNIVRARIAVTQRTCRRRRIAVTGVARSRSACERVTLVTGRAASSSGEICSVAGLTLSHVHPIGRTNVEKVLRNVVFTVRVVVALFTGDQVLFLLNDHFRADIVRIHCIGVIECVCTSTVTA